jgi:hypothetical protein
LAGGRGRIFAAFLTRAQAEPEVADAFRKVWIAPRRAEAKRALERHRRAAVLGADLDLDLAIEMMYAPLYTDCLLAMERDETVFGSAGWAVMERLQA